MRSLLVLREDGRHVVVIAGNHDNQALLDAVYRAGAGYRGTPAANAARHAGGGCRRRRAGRRRVPAGRARRARPGTRGGDKPSRVGRSPLQLFGDYLGEQNIEDPRIPRMFAELLDELTGADSSGLAAAGHGEA